MVESWEPALRIAIFAAVFVVLSLGETWAPVRAAAVGRFRRRTSNVLLLILNAALLRVIMPLSVVGVARLAENAEFGLFSALRLPAWISIPATVVLLDLAVYGQHVAMHKIPWLWRLHLVHHADLDFDVTTGLRFHTLEILLSAVYKGAVAVALGSPAVGVLIFEVLLNAGAMFSHSNMRLPRRIESLLRSVIVTPDMHRVHHSVIVRETNSNYGFNISWWDRWFGTYRDQPAEGHLGMTIGLSRPRDERRVSRLLGMLLLPFVDSHDERFR